MSTIFDKLFLEQSVHVNQLPPLNDLAARGKVVGDTVTTVVGILRNPLITPNRRINGIASLAWDLIGNNMTPAALAGVPQVHFGAQVSNDRKQGVILVPLDYHERVAQDFIFNAGAMVFVGSQARDWYNDKLAYWEDGKLVDGRQEVMVRARAYESEWLLMIKGLDLGYEFNEYQQKILDEYPEGIESRPDLIYNSKPFMVGEPTIEVPHPERN